MEPLTIGSIQFCRKYLLDDRHRLHPEGKTCALSHQSGIGSLPIISERARFFPSDKNDLLQDPGGKLSGLFNSSGKTFR